MLDHIARRDRIRKTHLEEDEVIHDHDLKVPAGTVLCGEGEGADAIMTMMMMM
jgi:hypothetical protein